jgi:hypothetical protein
MGLLHDPRRARPPTLLHLVHVAEHTARDADDENFEAAPCLVLHAARDIDDHAAVQLDFLAVEAHPALAGEHVIDFIGSFVEMELRIGDLQMMHLGCGGVLLLEHRADLAAGLGPRRHVGDIAPEESGSRIHGEMLRLRAVQSRFHTACALLLATVASLAAADNAARNVSRVIERPRCV